MGLIICILYIRHIWHKHYDTRRDPLDCFLNYKILSSESIFYPILPSDSGFTSLCWAAGRRGIVFLLSAILIYYVNFPLLNTILLLANLLYSALAVYVYFHRRRVFRGIFKRSNESDLRPHLLPAQHACATLAVYAFILQIGLYLVYGFRP